MKYTVFYERKARVAAYEMVNIGLSKEFDENTPAEAAFVEVRDAVGKWVDEEVERLEKEAPRGQ